LFNTTGKLKPSKKKSSLAKNPTESPTLLFHPNQINRLVIEKPFGKDTEDCRKMMQSIAKDWEEEEVYRIDHYLGTSSRKPCPYISPLIDSLQVRK
jgi:hypothetical protein